MRIKKEGGVKMDNQLIKKVPLFDYKKYEDESDEIKKIIMCLDYIKQKLKTKSISVMVGAGFSLNANSKKNKTDSKYEDWLSLLLPAYKEVYPDKPECIQNDEKKIKENIQAIGESVFAEEYEKFKGSREFLDLYIEKRICDINKTTDDLTLHYKLLKFNWCDIITTNWDDLLERANYRELKYTTIFSAKDLRYRNNDRIIKLHGSIRTDKQRMQNEYNFDNTYNYLYLITSTDFEKYKIEHEDFSNFMKVKILENPFCLMGFSGRDSNFRYWIKELKRTMLKGGNTEKPNPIFLFDVNPIPTAPKDVEYEKALDLFYHNNYIIRLKILDLFSYLNNTSSSSIPNINLQKYNPKLSNPSVLSHYDLNNFIFDWLNTDFTSNTVESNEIKEIDSIKDKEYKLLYNIASSKVESLNVDDYNQYNRVNLFSFQNLNHTSSLTFLVQNLTQYLGNWTKETFIFLYRWCLGNYYSLTNLFEEEKINNIIKLFEEKKYIETEAYIFSELILKYYREENKYEEFEKYCQNISKYSKLKNIIQYSKALIYIDNLDYKSLKKLLDEWYPEAEKELNSLFIIRKISLMSIFENAHFKESMKEDENQRKYVISLFTLALDNCKEGQLKLFIALLQKYYLQSFYFEPNYFNAPLIESLREQDFTDPYKYLEEFKTTASKSNDISSNQSKRYSISWTLGGNGNNQGILNAIRIFNFFEYTGLSMDLFLDPKRIISMIPDIRKSSYFLIKMLIHCISYYGNDSEEDFAKNTLEKIIRYLQKTEIKSLFNAFFDILLYKIENNQNARSYLFIINELTKYLDKDSNFKFYNFIYNEIKKSDDNNNQIKNLIRRGKVWGAARPFNDYLNQITNKEEYQYILKWIINEYILDERALSKQEHYSPSEFYSYYFTLIQKNPNQNCIKLVFEDGEIIKLLEEDFSYDKQLCLYGYEYLPKELKQKTKEFFEKDYTIHTDPFFIKHFKSETLKERILQIIKRDNILTYNSSNYPISTFIRMLYQEDMINIDDKKIICSILKDDYTTILEHIEHFNYGFKSLKDNISEFFYCLEEITTVQERKDYPEINETYEIIKKEFLNQIKPFYTFDWLYNSDTQKFRISFTNAVSYFSYLRQAKQYLYIFNIVLSKLIVQDDSNFEAVLELFINIYSKNYEKSVLKNKDTHELLIQLMKKFKLEIPYCYDYLFMKKQMKLLATALEKNNVQDEVIEYWINVK